jgi:hypothetical protein
VRSVLLEPVARIVCMVMMIVTMVVPPLPPPKQHSSVVLCRAAGHTCTAARRGALALGWAGRRATEMGLFDTTTV